jgi:excisionase family DNA binding protein
MNPSAPTTRVTQRAEVASGPARLLTAREVAAQLNVSTETVLRWTRAGALPAFRLPGGALRYQQDQLTEWLTDKATSTAKED